MRTLSELCLGILLLAALAWASDPWTAKPYQQWDKKDIAKVLNGSPWVTSETVTSDWQTNGSPGMPEGPEHGQMPPASSGSPTGAGTPSIGGVAAPSSNVPMGEPSMGGAPQNNVTFQARWISARTVREALVRSQVLDGKMNEAQAGQYVAQQPPDYQVVVFGRDMTPFLNLDEATLAKSAYLQTRNSKQRIAPDKVEIHPPGVGERSEDITFSFPKTVNGQPTIGPDDKQVDIVCRVGTVMLRFAFDAQKMTDQQGRDL